MLQSSLATWLLPQAAPAPSRPPQQDETQTREKSTGHGSGDDQKTGSLLQKLPPQASIQPLTDEHMLYFQRLNALLLPIPYQSSFYKETQHDPVIASLTKIVTWKCADCSKKMSPSANKFMREASSQGAQLVAAIRCRLVPADPARPTAQEHNLYISTIGTLAPFRGHGLAGQLLKEVMKIAVEQHGINVVVAHVWEDNEDALEWYQNRGFKIIRKEKNYYRRLAPKTDAWVIRKEIQPSDLIS